VSARSTLARMRKITLQISLAPTDVRHARILLPHQLRTWGAQVDEVLLVVDETPGRGARFGDGAARDKPELDALIETLRGGDPKVRRVNVDDAPDVTRAVARRFFGRDDMPANDFRGGPFYAYMYALHAAEHDLVLHVDADMLFGGGSDRWVAEAAEILEHRPDVLACNPLPGPPSRDGMLHNQPYVIDPEIAGAYRFHRISTRVFLLDRRRLLDRVVPLPLRPRPRLRSALTAVAGRHPLVLAPEDLISHAMQRAGMVRLDFLGRPPGMWSLHPVVRPEAFFAVLPTLLARVERGEVTDAQRGHYDIHPSMLEAGS
jgi:hypothetical protein